MYQKSRLPRCWAKKVLAWVDGRFRLTNSVTSCHSDAQRIFYTTVSIYAATFSIVIQFNMTAQVLLSERFGIGLFRRNAWVL